MSKRLWGVAGLVLAVAAAVLASGSPESIKRMNGSTKGLYVAEEDTLWVDGVFIYDGEEGIYGGANAAAVFADDFIEGSSSGAFSNVEVVATQVNQDSVSGVWGDSLYLYAACNSTLASYSMDADGSLTPLYGTAAGAVSVTGMRRLLNRTPHYYVMSGGPGNVVRVYEREVTGQLTLLDTLLTENPVVDVWWGGSSGWAGLLAAESGVDGKSGISSFSISSVGQLTQVDKDYGTTAEADSSSRFIWGNQYVVGAKGLVPQAWTISSGVLTLADSTMSNLPPMCAIGGKNWAVMGSFGGTSMALTTLALGDGGRLKLRDVTSTTAGGLMGLWYGRGINSTGGYIYATGGDSVWVYYLNKGEILAKLPNNEPLTRTDSEAITGSGRDIWGSANYLYVAAWDGGIITLGPSAEADTTSDASEPVKMDSLSVADMAEVGDSLIAAYIRAFGIKADTMETDTLKADKADLDSALVARFLQISRSKADTSAIDSLTAGMAHIDTLSVDSLTAERIDADTLDATVLLRGGVDVWATIRDTVLQVYDDTLSVSVHDTADALRGEMSGYVPSASFSDSMIEYYNGLTAPAVHDTAESLRAELGGGSTGQLTANIDSLGLHVAAPYWDGSKIGYIQGTASVDTIVIPSGDWWVGADLLAELDNGVLSPYTRALGANIGVTVYADTGHVGAMTGGAFYNQVSGGAGMVMGKSNIRASTWGVISDNRTYIDSIIAGPTGSGSVYAYLNPDTVETQKMAALRTETVGGANVDTLVSIWMKESASNDYGIYQEGDAPNYFGGTVTTPGVVQTGGTLGTVFETPYENGVYVGALYLDATAATLPADDYWATLMLDASIGDSTDVNTWMYGIYNELDVTRAYADSSRMGTTYGTYNFLNIWSTNGANGPSINIGDSGSGANVWADYNQFRVYVDTLYSVGEGSGGILSQMYFAGTTANKLAGVMIQMEPSSTAAGDSIVGLWIEESDEFGGAADIDYGIFQNGNAPNVLGGSLSIDVDGTRTAKAYDLSVYDGASYSRLDAGSDWTASSSKWLKRLGAPFSRYQAAKIVSALQELTVQNWFWKKGRNKDQHVGPTAEDWYAIAKLVAPEAADSLEISNEHVRAALLVAVGELARRNAELDAEVADLQQRLAAVEAFLR